MGTALQLHDESDFVNAYKNLDGNERERLMEFIQKLNLERKHAVKEKERKNKELEENLNGDFSLKKIAEVFAEHNLPLDTWPEKSEKGLACYYKIDDDENSDLSKLGIREINVYRTDETAAHPGKTYVNLRFAPVAAKELWPDCDIGEYVRRLILNNTPIGRMNLDDVKSYLNEELENRIKYFIKQAFIDTSNFKIMYFASLEKLKEWFATRIAMMETINSICDDFDKSLKKIYEHRKKLLMKQIELNNEYENEFTVETIALKNLIQKQVDIVFETINTGT